MRKVLATLCLSILLLSSGVAFAADALYRMLHADEVESFKKDQDAMIVGKLIGRQDDNFTVEVLKVLSGEVKSSTISVSSDFYYGWSQTMPMVNDFCVMSIKKSLNVYNKAWGIFKADSGNYKILKLVPENANSPGLSADLACIEWYVNSGGIEKDFSFDSGTAYVRRPNGQVIQLYPKESTKDSTVTTGLTQQETVTKRVDKFKLENLSIYFVVVTVGLIIILAVYLKRRKNTSG